MKKWTVEEVEYLQEHWGAISIPSIAKKLSRSIYAVKNKAYKIGLERHIHNGEYITFHQLIKAIGQECNYSYYSTKLQNYDFPMKHKKSINKSYKIVYIEEFWEWAEQNQTKLDFSKFEKNMLGPEPEWAKIKRRNDKKSKAKYSTKDWTKEDDKKLQELLNQYKYSYRDLCKILKRTEGAIQRRICELKLKARPIKADNHTKWTEAEYEKLAEMIKERYDYNEMSEVLRKSSKAIRGRVYDMYLSENLDNVVKMMGSGKWGHGRPELNITHKKLNGEERKQVKKDLRQFVGLLKGVMKSKYGENDYWQSEICQNWSNECLVNETCCDECLNFIRIKPQYCRRCGETILSRTTVNMCTRCKEARKKAHQRKYMALKGECR